MFYFQKPKFYQNTTKIPKKQQKKLKFSTFKTPKNLQKTSATPNFWVIPVGLLCCG
jgi:hypothetical protein